MRPILLTWPIWVALAVPARGEELHTFGGKTVEGWIAVLREKASTEAQRRQAAVMLGCFGPEARAAAPDLIETVRKGQIQGEAVGALVSMGAGAEVTTPILVDEFLKRGYFAVGPGLGTYYHSGSPIGALARVGEPVVPALTKVLDGPDEILRVHAAQALKDLGPAARAAVPSLIRTLERIKDVGKDEILFENTVEALGRIGPEARAAIPALNRRADHGAGYNLVVWALDRIGSPAVQELLDEFQRGGNPDVANLLAWHGPRAIAAAPRLRAMLSDGRLRFRVNAAVILAQIDRSATNVIPVLVEGLSPHDDEAVAAEDDVARALARFGPQAKSALPVLASLVTKGWASSDVLKALVKIDPDGEKCLPALIQALEHEDSEVARVAANCLGLLGPRAKDAIPPLTAVVTRVREGFILPLPDEDPQVGAARALRRVGPPGTVAIPALIRAVKDRRRLAGEADTYSQAAAAAAESLGSFGTEARGAIPVLIEALRSHDEHFDDRLLRPAAALALGRIRPEARTAIPALRAYIDEREKSPWDQAEAIIALYRLAPDGRQIAERWLQKPIEWSNAQRWFADLRARAMVLGAMGRTSFESDWVTRLYLDRLDFRLSHSLPFETAPLEQFESWFEEIGRLGTAARPAIPRLKGLGNDPSPFVRLWAAEALERITPQK
jgi:HEAT repeat protein